MNDSKQAKYSVRKGHSQYGPLSPKKIIECLKLAELPFDIQVFNPNTSHWIALSRHTVLSPMISEILRQSSLQVKDTQSIFGHWYIANGADRFGPFSLLQMIQFLQQKRLAYDDLVYHQTHHTWQRVNEIKTFNDNNVKALFNFPLLRPLFKMRQNPRVNYSNKVLLYDENSFYNGTASSLSSQGVGIVIEKPTPFKMGNSLQLHINRHVKHSAVQVPCRVVSRQVFKGGERLGLAFDSKVDALAEYIAELNS